MEVDIGAQYHQEVGTGGKKVIYEKGGESERGGSRKLGT